MLCCFRLNPLFELHPLPRAQSSTRVYGWTILMWMPSPACATKSSQQSAILALPFLAICFVCVLMVLQRYTRDSSYVMANGTWCPFNSQNTALHRNLIPAYVLSPLIGRMDDIWARCDSCIFLNFLVYCCLHFAVTLHCASWIIWATAVFSVIR